MPAVSTWSGSHRCTPAALHRPPTEAALQALVSGDHPLKVIGAGHSFSALAMTAGHLVSLDALDQLLSIDRQAGLHGDAAGCRLAAFNAALAAQGLALPIVGSIAAQSLAGLCATGTHGSSLRHGNLSSLVMGGRLITPQGEVIDIGPDDPRLPALRVHLGALGLITQLTFQVVPAFTVAQTRQPLPFDEALEAFPAAAAQHEYCKLWWIPHTDQAILFTADRSEAPPNFSPLARRLDALVVNQLVFRALLGLGDWIPAWIPPINRLIAATYLGTQRVVGPSDQVLSLAMPPRHREAEMALPAAAAPDALRALRKAQRDQGLRINFIAEARYVKGDDAWMSPAYGRDSVQIGAYISAPQDREAWYAALDAIGAPHGGRPHWGKEHRLDPSTVRRLYPRAGDFIDLARQLDPQGRLRNPALDAILGPA